MKEGVYVMDYLYIKMVDNGFLNDKLWLASDEKPDKFLIEELALQYDETSQKWFSNLKEISYRGAEIVFIAPYEQEQVGRKTIIKNFYILKIQDLDYVE